MLPKKLPEKIESAVQTIRKEYGHYVQAKLIRGRYMLFEATSIYDPETKKPRKITRYLGWLTDAGQLIPARHNDMKTKLFNEVNKDNEQKIKELEESLKIAEKKTAEEGIRRKETEKHERDILRALSMNARITVPELSKITGLSNTAVNYHLRHLEKRYDLKYLLEIDIEKFGYINYIAFVKFKDKRPSYEEMKEQLEKIPHVQVAMTTKGTYDVVIFLVVKSTNDARSDIYDVISAAFTSYDVEWIMSPAYQHFGFIPLRDKFFNILKEKVWTRTKEKPRPAHDEITEMEYKVLKAMNGNAKSDFIRVDVEIGTDKGRSNYAYHQLTKKGIIKRSTISMQDLHSELDMIILLNYTNLDKWRPTRENLLLEILKEKQMPFDAYSFTCDTMAPNGIMMIKPVASAIKGNELEKTINSLSQEIKGVDIDTLIKTSILIGSLNYRLFDKTQTSQYGILISGYNYTPESLKLKIATN
jgi:DNA-binding Lrp family transcriptional regulator